MNISIFFLLVLFFITIYSQCIPQNCYGKCINGICCQPYNLCNDTCCNANQTCSFINNKYSCDCPPQQVCGPDKICCPPNKVCNVIHGQCDCLPQQICGINKICCALGQICNWETNKCDCPPQQVCGPNKICCGSGQICNWRTGTCDCPNSYCNNVLNGTCISDNCCYPKEKVCYGQCCKSNEHCSNQFKKCVTNLIQ